MKLEDESSPRQSEDRRYVTATAKGDGALALLAGRSEDRPLQKI